MPPNKRSFATPSTIYPTSLLQVSSGYENPLQDDDTNCITSSWINILLFVRISYAVTISIFVLAIELLCIVAGYVNVFLIKSNAVVDEFTISILPPIELLFCDT